MEEGVNERGRRLHLLRVRLRSAGLELVHQVMPLEVDLSLGDGNPAGRGYLCDPGCVETIASLQGFKMRIHVASFKNVPEFSNLCLTIMAAGSGSEPAATGSKRFAWLYFGLGTGDLDADGLSDVLVGDTANIYLISGRDLQDLGSTDGLVGLQGMAVPRNSWKLGFINPRRRFRYTVSRGDLDGDDSTELIIQAQTGEGDSALQASYVISTTELAVLDSLDGKADRVINLDYVSRRWEDN